jgi:hypothetical protein
MDPLTIAAGAVALLSPVVKKAMEEFAGDAGKAIWEKAKGLFARLRRSLAGEPAAEEALGKFERDPEGGKADLQARLKERFERDEALRKEVEEVLKDIKRTGPDVRVVQRVKEAEDVVGIEAKRMSRGSAEVEQEMDRARGVTGAKFDEIG